MILPVIILIMTMLSGCKGSQNREAVEWQPWENTLYAKKQLTGRPAGVDVIFTGPDGKVIKIHAFTDDGQLFRFRMAFPDAGTWSWVTNCTNVNDRGLHNRKGTVEVKAYSGDNPLYKHGDLSVSADGRYLVHADGTPFLWIGDTGWRSTQIASMDEWQYYINTRAEQKFSIIQVSPKGVSKNPGRDLAKISFTDEGKIDPSFWDDLDAKIEYANEKGIVILMVGISKVWSDEFVKNPENQPLEYYITGRYAPYMVILSPSFDQIFMKGNDSVAVELNKLTDHLVTQHPGTNYQANLRYRNSPSVDFCGMQSGHHGGRIMNAYNAARQWTLDMYNGEPVKPVINIEGMYDGYGHNNAPNWREKDVRKIGWISWLSGSKGYTYGAGDIKPKVPQGAGGVWRFNTDSASYDYWRKAVKWPSAGHMTVMHDFFEPVDWWTLVPAHELILNQSANDSSMMVTSLNSDKSLLLAYLPNNTTVELNLGSLSGTMEGSWFNPVAGEYIPVGFPVNPGRKQAFRKPDGWDDALLILKRK
jgi:hypothetical protein